MPSRSDVMERWLLFMVGVVAGLVIVASMLSSIGCATTGMKCPPPPECPTIEEETYACPDPGELPELVLPSFPMKPLELVRLNAWIADVSEAMIARERIMRDRINALERLLDKYRHPPE